MSTKQMYHIFCLVTIIGASALLGALFFVSDFFWHQDITLDIQTNHAPSIMLDDAGNELGRFARDQRNPIALADIPNHVINAFIAAEDWRFFDHMGISIKGIIRSSLINLYHGRYVQGASTITQQLVRLLFFDTHKTFTRKIKEQIVALWLEWRFSKEQILQAYLNNVYFGCGIYGIQAAAQRFWSISVAQVSIDQAAAMAAVMRSPGNYCPLLCPLSCQRRRNVILGTMRKLGFITIAEYEHAAQQPLHVQSAVQVRAPYVKEYIRQMLEERYGKQMLYSGGLIIQTTINSTYQEAAERHFSAHIAQLRSTLSPQVDGGLVSMEPSTGQVKALVGGIDFQTSQFNRATQARRQMGSIFKPLVYAAALQQGIQWHEVMIDEPLEVVIDGKPWRPKNNDNTFHGPMTLAYALSHSTNSIAVKLLLTTGIQPIMQLANRCRLSGPVPAYPSLALGCVEASVWEAVGMFNIFANHGVYVEPHCIRWVKDRWGTKIYKATPEREQILDARISDQIAQVLTHWFERVRTLYPQPWIASDALCKTGTTNDSRTCWFVGSTPVLTTGMYIGCDDNSSLGNNVYPLRTAFPLWMTYNRNVETNKTMFQFDAHLHKRWINELTGEPAAKGEAGAIALLV